MLFEFKREVHAANCLKNISKAFGGSTLSKTACYHWFKKFENEVFDLRNEPRNGRPIEIDDDLLKQFIEENSRPTSGELTVRFNVKQSTVIGHIGKLGMISKLDTWLPHLLTVKNLKIGTLLVLSVRQNCLFVRKRKVFESSRSCWWKMEQIWKSSMEKNVMQQRWWTATPKQEIYAKKIILYYWWDSKGIVYYELATETEPNNQFGHILSAIDKTTWSASKKNIKLWWISKVPFSIRIMLASYLHSNTKKIEGA